MSYSKFDDECAGCKPAMMDVETGKVIPDDAPSMMVVLRVWSTTTLAERQAWHRFTCLSSRTVDDVHVARSFAQRVEEAFAEGRK